MSVSRKPSVVSEQRAYAARALALGGLLCLVGLVVSVSTLWIRGEWFIPLPTVHLGFLAFVVATAAGLASLSLCRGPAATARAARAAAWAKAFGVATACMAVAIIVAFMATALQFLRTFT